jgi:hypothetical protein
MVGVRFRDKPEDLWTPAGGLGAKNRENERENLVEKVRALGLQRA